MIAQLTGKITQRNEESLTLDVNGVGYEVFVSASTLARMPSQAEKTTLVIYTSVREDNISLFGFLTLSEKKLFLKLLSVSGIGPKLSMSVLSGLPPQELIQAIYREDLLRLTSISGIGKKTAERIILELKDKLLDLVESPFGKEKGLPKASLPEDILSALINLGYNRGEIEKKLQKIHFKDPQNFEQSLKESLQILAKS